MILSDLSPLANHLWQSTLFSAAAWLLALAVRKNRAAVRYWIWMAASVKFLIPFSAIVSIGSRLGWRAAPITAQPQLTLAINEISRPFALSTSVPTLAVSPSPNYLAMILTGVWLCGVTLGLIFWVRSLWQMRTLVRTATPLDLKLPVPVMISPARLEPGIFGIRKPVLLLPEGITDRLTPAQLEAVIAHELCHLRRRDNLTAAIHMVVEILFWFLPLVWWIRTQLVAARESACDEEVIRTIDDPHIYAEGILNVCKFYLESPSPCVSGVTGADLRKRINAILIARTPRNLNLWRRIVLATAVFAAVAGPVALGILHPVPGLAQQPQAEARMAFEVASIKPGLSNEGRNTKNPGGIDYKWTWVSMLMQEAYGIKDYQLVLPRGYQQKEWEVIAKAPANSRVEDIPLMLRSLLADRFHLAFHRETRQMQVYELVVARGGSKLKEVDPPGGGFGTGRTAQGMLDWKGKIPLSLLARGLTNALGMPVIDKTGIEGIFDIEFETAPLGAGTASAGGVPTTSLPGPNISDALEEALGLKLEPRKDPIEILVVDHVDSTPTEN